jgi:hypothetical protein
MNWLFSKVPSIEYKIVSFSTKHDAGLNMKDLMDHVNTLLKEGWEPQGGICCTGQIVCQALIKKI